MPDASIPAVVFGARGKLRAEGPFLSLLAEFENQIARTDELIVVGYSFRDDHINEAIRLWTTAADSRHLVVVDPGFPKNDTVLDLNRDFRAQLRHYLVPTPPGSVGRGLEIKRVAASAALRSLFGSTP
jgi:hypothetical protein